MKRGGALSIQRGTEKTQEEQGQKPECYHFRDSLRTWGTTKGPQDEEAETQRAETKSISRHFKAHRMTGCQSSQARVKDLDLVNHKGPWVPFARDISGK